MTCWSFLLLRVHSNSVRTTDKLFLVPFETSWSNTLQVTVTGDTDMVGQADKWVNMPAKCMYYKKYVLQGAFLPLLLQNIKQDEIRGIFSQIYQRLIGDKSASAGDGQHSFPLLPYNAWLLIYLVKGELLISAPL